MPSMKVSVTTEDIKQGKRVSCRECPVALAVKRIFQDEDNVSVAIYIRVGGVMYEYPEEVVDFICNFDKGSLVEPIEFEMKEAFRANN